MPQTSLDSFAPEFREGMAARAEVLGDTGESGPDHWEEPLGSRRRPRGHRRPLRRRGSAPGRGGEGPQGPRRAPRDRADLASGLLPAPDRADLLRVQGRHRPSLGRGKRPTPDELPRAAPQGRRDHPGLSRRDGRAAAHADPGRAGSQRHLRRVPQAAHQGRGVPELPARQIGEPGGGGPAGGEDGRALAERRPARARARPGRPGARRRPAPQQRVRLRRRPPWLQVPCRCPRPPGQPARRAATTKAAWTSGSTG